MKKKLHQDIYISIITYIFTAVMLILGRNIKSAARAYPFLILGLITVLNTILLITTIIKSKKMSAEELDAVNTIRWSNIRHAMLTFIIIAAYVVIFDILGYFIATALLLVGMMLLLGVRDWKVLVFVPVGLLAVLYYFFVMKLHVPLM